MLLPALAVLATSANAQAATHRQTVRHRTTYYVSLGDSYAVGYQPDRAPPRLHRVRGQAHRPKLVNFGCGGATTTSILNTVGCPDVLPHTTGGMTYPTTTQIAAADAFITAHKGHIGLITVSIGGNDVTGVRDAGQSHRLREHGGTGITTNVTTLAGDLRTAAGPKVPIIGSTYPDVILGSYVYPKNPAAPATVNLAKLSVVAFKSLINPALSKAYAAARARWST